MAFNNKSFKLTLLGSCGIFITVVLISIIVTPLIPRYLIIFDKEFKVQHNLFDIYEYESEYTRINNKEDDHDYHTGYSLTTNKDWTEYYTVQGMRAWSRINIELEKISDLTMKNPEQTIMDGVGDRNDFALLLVNMIYVISEKKVDLVSIKEDNPKSDFPMYYLYYQDVIYEVFNNRNYRNRQIIEHIPFDKLFSNQLKN